MIALSIAAGVVALLISGAIAGERKRRLRQGYGALRRADFDHISRRDLLKYK